MIECVKKRHWGQQTKLVSTNQPIITKGASETGSI